MKDVTEVVRKQFESCGTKKITFHPRPINVFSTDISPSVTTNYILACREELKREVIESHDSSNVKIEKNDDNKESFVGYVQLFSEMR